METAQGDRTAAALEQRWVSRARRSEGTQQDAADPAGTTAHHPPPGPRAPRMHRSTGHRTGFHLLQAFFNHYTNNVLSSKCFQKNSIHSQLLSNDSLLHTQTIKYSKEIQTMQNYGSVFQVKSMLIVAKQTQALLTAGPSLPQSL